MAFEGNELNSGISNHFLYNHRNQFREKYPKISELIVGSNHTLVIDSKNRNLKFHPDPSNYDITFPIGYKNVTSLELKGSSFPKSEYNVNSSNNIIPFNIQDFITSATIKDPGFGYINGVYTSIEGVSVSPPAISGTQAEVTITVTNNKISSVIITIPGSGYLRGHYSGIGNTSNGFYKNFGASIYFSSIPKENSLIFKQGIIDLEVGNISTSDGLLPMEKYRFMEQTASLDSQPSQIMIFLSL